MTLSLGALAPLPGAGTADPSASPTRGADGQGFSTLLLSLLGWSGPAEDEAPGPGTGTGTESVPAVATGETTESFPGATTGETPGSTWPRRRQVPASAPVGAASSARAPAPETSGVARYSAPAGNRTPTVRAGWVALAEAATSGSQPLAPATPPAPVAPEATPRASVAPALPETPRSAPVPSEMAVPETVPPEPAVRSVPDGTAPAVTGALGPVPPAPGNRPPADVDTADKALSKLDPELRTKVERVMERMASEHGIRVTLAEGYRTPERQRHLYAQGRTRPGPVVTWTNESLHSRGMAADLKVEGPWNQPRAYGLLQRIATEEGLGTLGAKDPGHVELRGSREADGASPRAGSLPTPPWSASEEGVMRGAQPREAAPGVLAPEASVARVARTARVAPVASPARVGVRAGREQAPAAAEAARSEPSVPPAPPAPPADTPVRHDSQAAGGALPHGGTQVATEAPLLSSAPLAVDTLQGADPLSGVERVREVREVMASAPTHRVTLRLEGSGAPVERVRIELVEQALRGELDVKDPILAARLRGDAGTLLRTLESRGYESPSLSIGGGAALAGAGDASGDLFAAVTRGDGLPHALRALLGEAAPSSGRGAQDPGAGGQRNRDGRPEGQSHDTRRDNRRESR